MSNEMPIAKVKTNTINNSTYEVQSQRLAKPWYVSNNGIAFIAQWESGVLNGKNYKGQKVVEGQILTVFDDGYGNPTVGLGHLVLPKDNLKIGDTISIERGRELAREDLLSVERAINNSVYVPLFQHEYDALVSILFNSGIGKKYKTDPKSRMQMFADMLNKGKHSEVPDFIRTFVAGKTKTRRVSESVLFRDGVYNAEH